ncbi:glycine--tRNA ligase subunit beta [Halomonas denitrificans]|nr:glycine--tRNA ligase subunit beta [Halomonas denitrificans]
MSRELLIELGCEELPARALRGQAEGLLDGVLSGLRDAGLAADDGKARWFATPRRLSVSVADVATRQPDRVLERKGPAEQAAFDDSGQPTRAALGFARSVGLDVEQLDRIENEQGRWLYAEVKQEGQTLAAVLQDVLEKAVRGLASARSMRWSDRSERFLRPVRWLVVLHGDDVLPIELFGLHAGRETRGHRVHAPEPSSIASASEYESVLEKARVIADFEARKARIAEQVASEAGRAGLKADDDDALLDEVTGLVEWPVACTGSFDPAFLEVPPEALVSAMRIHQKCFPLYDAAGDLAPHFITVANLDSLDRAAMVHGYERVIRPRLADARFFFDQDRATPLEQRVEGLEAMQFQDRLGSIADKTRRLERLAVELAPAFEAAPETAFRAARLSKCDLLTEMVGEFPELQGTMGRHYALADGEAEAVAVAIEEHYQPRQAGGRLPQGEAGRALAVADRLDTLVGVFAAGKKPKGSKDPFALRRAALGVVRILDDAQVDRPLSDLVERAAEVLRDRIEVAADVVAEVVEFIEERLRAWMVDQGLDVNTLKAAAAGNARSVPASARRARSLQRFADDPEMESLIAANKRAANLLRQSEMHDFGEVRENSLILDAERMLFDEVCRAEAEVSRALSDGDDDRALAQLASLKPAVDAFFENVMVMDEDEALRANRLALVHRLRSTFLAVADVALLGRA